MFERRGDRLGFAVVDARGSVPRPELDDELPDLLKTLENHLAGQGRYRDEAHAMVETWRDQWFEDGLRVFYALPRSETDGILPIGILCWPGRSTRGPNRSSNSASSATAS